jgi:hypothetical protein
MSSYEHFRLTHIINVPLGRGRPSSRYVRSKQWSLRCKPQPSRMELLYLSHVVEVTTEQQILTYCYIHLSRKEHISHQKLRSGTLVGMNAPVQGCPPKNTNCRHLKDTYL